jgi:glycosyltransferase involved in cell wall biosynthesis
MEKIVFSGDRIKFHAEVRTFDELHGITLFCCLLNEEATIKAYLEYYKPYVDKVVLVDGGSVDNTIEIASPLVDNIALHKFDGHCSNQFNRTMELVRTDWALFLEPDERLDKRALGMLKGLINQEEYDAYSFPRREFIDGVEDCSVYPDYQDRLFRTYCRRVRPVHGELVGYKSKKILSTNDIWDIKHIKSSKIHTFRNQGWAMFAINFANELGIPGAQTKNSFIKMHKTILLSPDGDIKKNG